MSRISNLIKKVQSYKGQEFKQPKMFVPAGCVTPQTAKDTMARQLYQAGIISRDDYEKMLGVVYDDNIENVNDERFDDEAFSTFDDEFKMSELAEYYDDYSSDIQHPIRENETSREQDTQSRDAVEPANDPSATSVSPAEGIRAGESTQQGMDK